MSEYDRSESPLDSSKLKPEATRQEGPGARLRLLRQAKGLDNIEDIAKQLRLNPQRLLQLESDDYGTMGSSAYAYGYLRSYARLLGMAEAESAELLQLFQSLNLGATIRTNTPKLIHEKMVATNPRATRRFGYLIVLILVGMLAFWWHKHSSTMNKDSTEKVAATNTTHSESTAATSDSDKAMLEPVPLQTIMVPTDNQSGTVATDVMPPITADDADAATAAAPAQNQTKAPTSQKRTRGNG